MKLPLDKVFVAGGLPTVTYVNRENSHIERDLVKAITAPNEVVSIAGPSKSGKTVLCRKILQDRKFVWVEGGSIEGIDSLWTGVAARLNLPNEETNSLEISSTLEGGLTAGFQLKGNSSEKTNSTQKRLINSMAEAIDRLTNDQIVLVIDDFHYLSADVRTQFMRNVKGPVFSGLKVVLLSVTHRAFDGIEAEPDLTGRLVSIILPEWTIEELGQIAKLGFLELGISLDEQGVTTPSNPVLVLAREALGNPYLMQKFCFEMCYELGFNTSPRSLMDPRSLFDEDRFIPRTFDFSGMFVRLAKSIGLPLYVRLVAGPQPRKARSKRRLKDGRETDIYEALLLALARTGAKSTTTYEEIRFGLADILEGALPQKNEVASALTHMAIIAKSSVHEAVIDWDDDKRRLILADPYLRYYLKWQVPWRRQ